jgi:hypothetical protein
MQETVNVVRSMSLKAVEFNTSSIEDCLDNHNIPILMISQKTPAIRRVQSDYPALYAPPEFQRRRTSMCNPPEWNSGDVIETMNAIDL